MTDTCQSQNPNEYQIKKAVIETAFFIFTARFLLLRFRLIKTEAYRTKGYKSIMWRLSPNYASSDNYVPLSANLAGGMGFEPTTPGFGGLYSIQLS